MSDYVPPVTVQALGLEAARPALLYSRVRPAVALPGPQATAAVLLSLSTGAQQLVGRAEHRKG
ncbi:MAG: hypothetical protein H0U79_02830 [Solirubrobacterales bacterium]|nr:hypothetical protein [Solirubrobacterales bacterium]